MDSTDTPLPLDWSAYAFDLSSLPFLYDRPDIGTLQAAVELEPPTVQELFELAPPRTHSEMLAMGKVLQALGVQRPPARFSELETPDVLHFGEVRVLLGDTTLDGDLEVDRTLLVVGDLTLEGTLVVHETSDVLAVCGSITARHLWTAGSIAVGGDLNTAGYVYGDYNDGMLEVRGVLRARCVISDDHAIVYDPATAELVHRSPRYDSGYFQVYEFDEAEFELLRSVLPEGTTHRRDEGVYSVDTDALFAHPLD